MSEKHELSEGSDANENTGITREPSHDRNFSMGDIGKAAKSIGDAIGGVLGHEVLPSKGHPHSPEQPKTPDTAGSMSDSASSVNDAIGSAAGNAPASTGAEAGSTTSGPISAGGGVILNPGAAGVDDEFVGSGGVGSPEYMDALRRGHQEAGGDYASDLGDGGNIPDTEGGQGHT